MQRSPKILRLLQLVTVNNLESHHQQAEKVVGRLHRRMLLPSAQDAQLFCNARCIRLVCPQFLATSTSPWKWHPNRADVRRRLWSFAKLHALYSRKSSTPKASVPGRSHANVATEFHCRTDCAGFIRKISLQVSFGRTWC